MIEPDSKSAESSAPPSDVHQEDRLLSAPHKKSQVYWDDSSSCSSSEDELNLLNLDAGLYLVFMELGDQSLAEDQFLQAETYFRKALDRVQNSSTLFDRRLVRQKIGVVCLEQGKYDEAKAIFDEHPDLARSIIVRVFAKARTFYEQKQYQCALNFLQRALTDTHDAPADVVREMRMLFGLAYFALNEFAKAGNQFSLVLLPEDQPEDSRSLEAHHNLALVHLRQAEVDRAIEHAQTASKGRWRLFTRDHATSQESLAVLVDAFEAKGDTEEAKAYSKLLTEDNLKVRLLLHDAYFLVAEPKQERVIQLNFVTWRNRFSGLRKRDRILARMDDKLFADEIESFIKHILTPENGRTQAIEDDSSLLIVAAQDGRSVIVRALLRVSKLEVRASDLLGDTALHHAVRNGFEEVVILLLRQIGTGVNNANHAGETALAIATRARNEPMVRILLQDKSLNPNLEVRKKQGDSKIISHGPALHMAVINKSDSIVDLFLRYSSNIDLNYRDAQGRTPLHYAVLSANARICEMLLQQASVRLNSVMEPEKQSILSLAIINDMPKLAHQLIATREVEVNTLDYQGHSALHHSAWSNQPAIMTHLLERRSLDLNLRDLCGRTALHIAASCGNAKLVKQLLTDSRTNFGCKNNYGETPLAAARAANYKDVAKLLEGHQIELKVNEFLL
jgi:ankyrin repeat protein/Tfp pilus assembly protein PilF